MRLIDFGNIYFNVDRITSLKRYEDGKVCISADGKQYTLGPFSDDEFNLILSELEEIDWR